MNKKMKNSLAFSYFVTFISESSYLSGTKANACSSTFLVVLSKDRPHDFKWLKLPGVASIIGHVTEQLLDFCLI